MDVHLIAQILLILRRSSVGDNMVSPFVRSWLCLYPTRWLLLKGFIHLLMTYQVNGWTNEVASACITNETLDMRCSLKSRLFCLSGREKRKHSHEHVAELRESAHFRYSTDKLNIMTTIKWHYFNTQVTCTYITLLCYPKMHYRNSDTHVYSGHLYCNNFVRNSSCESMSVWL